MKNLLLLVILIVTITPSIAAESNGTVTRSFSSNNISLGTVVTVTLTPGGVVTEGFYQVREILPVGFTLISTNSDSTNISDRDIIFTKMAGLPFTYTITSPMISGIFNFSGTFSDNDRSNGTVDGDNTVDVTTPLSDNTSVVTRELSKNYTYTENDSSGILVTLKTTESGLIIYGIVETLPDNVSLSLVNSTNVNITKDGNKYMFITFGVNNQNHILLQYTINANNDTSIGNYNISGYYKNTPNSISPIPDSTFRIANNIFQAYDLNNDGVIEKNEAVAAVWDYFTQPSKIGLDDIIKLIRKYLVL